MGQIYYAIAWFYNISHEEAISIYDDLSDYMCEVIWACYEEYMHSRDYDGIYEEEE